MGSILADLESHFKEVHPKDLLNNGWYWCVPHKNPHKPVDLHKVYKIKIPAFHKTIEINAYYRTKTRSFIAIVNPFTLEPDVRCQEITLDNPSMPEIEAALDAKNVARYLYHVNQYYTYA